MFVTSGMHLLSMSGGSSSYLSMPMEGHPCLAAQVVFEGPVSRLEKDRDRTGPRLIKTITTVRSLVHHHSRKLKTRQRPVFTVSTDFSASKSCGSWGQISSISKSKILLSYINFQLIFDSTQMCDTWLENSMIDNNQQLTLI